MKPRLLVPLFLTVLLVAIGAIASACGGDGGDDQENAYEPWRQGTLRALQDMQQAEDDLPNLDDLGVGDTWLALVTRARDRLAAAEEDLMALEPPDAYAESHILFVDALDEAVIGFGLIEAAGHSIADGNLAEGARLLGEATDHISEKNRLVQEFVDTFPSPDQDDQSAETEDDGRPSSDQVPLYSSDVLDFTKGFVRGSGSQLEAANRELDRVIDSGQQVISCQYGPSDPEAQTGYLSYAFWYEDVPNNIDELLLVAGDSGVPDPVRHLGTNSRSSCPDSRDEGEAAWRAGRS